MPQHVHLLNASNVTSGGNSSPVWRVLGGRNNVYHSPASLTTMNSGSVTNTGGSQAHLNMQPFLTLNWCIALQGIFPSPN